MLGRLFRSLLVRLAFCLSFNVSFSNEWSRFCAACMIRKSCVLIRRNTKQICRNRAIGIARQTQGSLASVRAELAAATLRNSPGLLHTIFCAKSSKLEVWKKPIYTNHCSFQKSCTSSLSGLSRYNGSRNGDSASFVRRLGNDRR